MTSPINKENVINLTDSSSSSSSGFSTPPRTTRHRAHPSPSIFASPTVPHSPAITHTVDGLLKAPSRVLKGLTNKREHTLILDGSAEKKAKYVKIHHETVSKQRQHKLKYPTDTFSPIKADPKTQIDVETSKVVVVGGRRFGFHESTSAKGKNSSIFPIKGAENDGLLHFAKGVPGKPSPDDLGKLVRKAKQEAFSRTDFVNALQNLATSNLK